MHREHAAHDIFVDVDTESMRNLLRDAHTAELEIAALHLDDSSNELHGRTFETGIAAMGRVGIEQAVLAIDQRFVEFEQRRGFDERAQFRDLAGAQKQRGQSDQKTIEGGQIRRMLSGAITDQQLMFEK